MRATIISMVMRLPGSLPGMSVAGWLRPARERGGVKLGARPVSGPGQARPGAAYRRFLQRPWGYSTRFTRRRFSILGVRGSGEGFQARLDGLGHHGDLPLKDSVRPRLAPPS